MKLHTKLESLPIACYDNIQKSIAAGKPEYRWLLDFDYLFEELPEYSNLNELKEIFENLTYQFDELDLNLQSLYLKSVKSYVEYNHKAIGIQIKELENQEREINGLKPIKINRVNRKINNVYKSFDAYREKLNNLFTDFVFTEYYIETENEFLKDFTFYTKNQLLHKLSFHNLKIDFSTIKQREKKFKHIDFLHKYFLDFYQEIGMVNVFFNFRLSFFNLSNLRCKPKQSPTDLDRNIIILEKILNKNIDKWKTSVKKYLKMQEVASEISKQSYQKQEK